MALLKGKYVDPNAPLNGDRIQLDNNQALKGKTAAGADKEILKVNASDKVEFVSVPTVTADPVDADDVARKSYVDSAASGAVSTLLPGGLLPTAMLFATPDGTAIDRSEFLTYDASIGLMLNVGGQLQTRSLEQGANDPSSVIINDKLEVLANEADGSVSKGRVTKDTIESRKLTASAEYIASMGWDGTDSWMGVSKTENAGNNISMSKIFPHKAQLFTVDIAAGTGPQAIMPVEGYDLTTKAYVDQELGGKADLVDGKVPSTQLPSYVDDVIEVDDLAALPAEGEASKIYVTKDTNKCYRWSGSGYVEISASPGTTDDVVEGSTNLYFTNERAKTAAVTNEIVSGVIDVAPSQDAVHQALALKQASLGTGTTSQFLRGDLTWQEVATSVGIAQTKIVSKGGSDVTGDGTLTKPYATIAAAMTSITDASPTKRYGIKVEAGAYTEGALTLKPNVFVIGDLKEAVRVTASSVALDSSFSGSADNRSGMGRIILTGACNFDWNAVTSAAGKLYFTEVLFNSAVTMNGYNNAIAQAAFDSCQFFGSLTVSGINVGTFKDNICYGNVTLNQHPNGGMATILSASGGYIGGTLTLTTTVNDFNRRCSAFLRGMYIENLTVDGASSYADADLISQGKSVPQLLNGGQLVAMTPRVNHDLETKMLKPLANNSHNSGDWGKQWMFNFAYVHASAGTDMYILSAMENYDPAGDTAGKTIFIQPDAYGLQANANGGNIELETAAVSGTGVRGKVKINAKELDLTNHKIVNLANATDSADAVNKGQMDSALGGKQDSLGTGTAGQYLAGDLSWQDLPASVVEDAIVDGETAKAPSQNAVYDALALKQDSLGTGTTSQYLRGDLSWQAIPAAITPKKETFVLNSTDISNGYIDCAHLSVTDSMLLISGGIPHIEGALEDYTLSSVGGVTRITFTTYFLGKLSVGDRIYLQYMY
jgi:hypothetical protein